MLQTLGGQRIDRGAYQDGETILTEALAEARRAGDREVEALSLAHLGVAAWGRGDPVTAVERLQLARTLARVSGHPVPAEVASRYLGLVAAESGDHAGAARWYVESAEDSKETTVLVRMVPDVASLAMARGDATLAARLFGAAAALADTISFAPSWPERGVHERAVTRARDELGCAFDDSFMAGRRLPRERVLADVAAVLTAASAPEEPGVSPHRSEGSWCVRFQCFKRCSRLDSGELGCFVTCGRLSVQTNFVHRNRIDGKANRWRPTYNILDTSLSYSWQEDTASTASNSVIRHNETRHRRSPRLRIMRSSTTANHDDGEEPLMDHGQRVLTRLHQAMNAHDIDAFVECFAEDYRSEQPVHPNRHFTGTAQVRTNWSRIFEAMPDFHADLRRSTEEADAVWSEWRWTGTPLGGGRLEMAGVIIMGVQDGRIAWGRLYVDDVEQESAAIDAAVRQMTQQPR